jgi:hypothetical protein
MSVDLDQLLTDFHAVRRLFLQAPDARDSKTGKAKLLRPLMGTVSKSSVKITPATTPKEPTITGGWKLCQSGKAGSLIAAEWYEEGCGFQYRHTALNEGILSTIKEGEGEAHLVSEVTFKSSSDGKWVYRRFWAETENGIRVVAYRLSDQS